MLEECLALPFENLNQYENYDLKWDRRADKKLWLGDKIQRSNVSTTKEVSWFIQKKVILPAHEPKLLVV